MSDQYTNHILSLMERLKSDLLLAERHSLRHTVQILQIALLDLQTVVHSISDDELRDFSDFVESRVALRKINGKVNGRRERRSRNGRSALKTAPAPAGRYRQ